MLSTDSRQKVADEGPSATAIACSLLFLTEGLEETLEEEEVDEDLATGGPGVR